MKLRPFPHCRGSVAVLSALAAMALQAAPATAGGALTRGFVSHSGQDIYGCGEENSPCRTFQYVHDNVLVAAGGEINVVDTADYGSINITKALVINGGGAGSIQTAGGGSAISINAPGAVVTLRNLILDGAKTGARGISFTGGSGLSAQNLDIRAFAGDGIYFNASGASFELINSTSSYNAGNGINIVAAGNVTLTGSRANFNTGGGVVSAATAQQIQNTSANSNGANGFALSGGYLGGSTATGNGSYGIQVTGTVYTYKSNSFTNNSAGTVSGTLTAATHQ